MKLSKIFELFYKANEPEIEKRLFCITTFISVMVSIFGLVVNVGLGLHWVLNFIVGGGILMLTSIFVLARYYNRYLVWEFILVALIILSGSWFYNNGIKGSTTYLYLLAFVVFMSITKPKQHIWVVLIIAINIFCLYIVRYFNPDLIHPYKSETTWNRDLLFTFIYTSFFTVLVFRAIRNGYDEERNRVKSQQVELKIQHFNILDSIKYAQGIQKAILQDESLLGQYFKSHFVIWRPKDKIGGDFYKVIPHPVTENVYYVVVADCTGHGVPGALLTMLGMSLISEILTQQKSISTNQVLDILREKVIEALSQDGNSVQSFDGMDMALCKVNVDDKKIEYAGANRSLYLLRKGELIEFKPDKFPIGVFFGDSDKFSSKTVKLEKDDTIYLTSDGYADQFSEQGRKFYLGEFKRLLIEICDQPLYTQKEILISRLNNWQGSAEQTDDVLVFAFKPI